MPATISMPDLPSFKVVAPRDDIKPSDLKLSDGTPMVGPDGLLVPAARQFNMIVNSANRVYSYRFDEALRDNQIGARAMRRDAFLEGLFEERILPTINREWQLEVDDTEDPNQRYVRDGLTSIIKGISDFDAFKRANLDGIWYGRSGCQWAYQRKADLGNKWGLSRWDPLHGDSIQFTFDGVPALLLDSTTESWYRAHGATVGPNGDLRPTDRGGTALVLHRPYWRDRFSIHVHMRRKADFFEGELAGSVQGLGLRGLVYWHYVLRTDALTWMLAYMQAVGQMDLLVFNYPAGNADAKLQQENNAQKIIGKAAIACPRDPKGNWPAVEQIQMNSAGLKALHDLIADYFDRHIERLFVGQSMSAGADKGTGLGGTGRADFSKATKDEILVYDTGRLDGTMTSDLIEPLKRYNYPWAQFPVRFKSVMPDLKAKDKVEAGSRLVSIGVPIKVSEIREAGGYSQPKATDPIVGMPMPPPPMDGPPGSPPGGYAGQLPPGMIPGQIPGLPPGTPQGAPAQGQLPAGPGMVPNAAYGPHGGANRTYGGPIPIPGQGPTNNDSGGGGVPPANGPVMGAPGGGNTYVPGFGRRKYPTFDPRQYGRTDYVEHGHEDFHRRIVENTQEDTGPLVYADWLEENGQPATAAFVREVVKTQRQYHDRNRTAKVMHYTHRPDPDSAAPEVNTVFHYQGLGAYRERRSGPRRSNPPPTIEVTLKSPYSEEIGGYLAFGLDVPHAEAKEWTKKLIAEGRVPGNSHRSSTLRSVVDEVARERARQQAPAEDPEQLSRYQRTDYRCGPFDYCSTQVNLTGYANILLQHAAKSIPDASLHEKGREDEPHVTVRWGLHECNAGQVWNIIKDVPQIRMFLGKVSVFAGSETGKDYDVLKVDVDSPDLVAINKRLGALPNTQTFPYHPHATIAYVKAGHGAALAAKMEPLNIGVIGRYVCFSDKAGNKLEIPLANTLSNLGP